MRPSLIVVQELKLSEIAACTADVVASVTDVTSPTYWDNRDAFKAIQSTLMSIPRKNKHYLNILVCKQQMLEAQFAQAYASEPEFSTTNSQSNAGPASGDVTPEGLDDFRFLFTTGSMDSAAPGFVPAQTDFTS